MRLGEPLGLKWDDLDLDDGRATIARSLQYLHRELTLRPPKTARSSRGIALSTATVEVLKEQRRTQLEHRLQLGPPYAAKDFVWADAIGRPLRPYAVSIGFRKVATAAGHPDVRFHDLRHTSATLALRANVHPKVVSERLGHASVNITLDTYSHVLPDIQRAAADALDAMIAAPISSQARVNN